MLKHQQKSVSRSRKNILKSGRFIFYYLTICATRSESALFVGLGDSIAMWEIEIFSNVQHFYIKILLNVQISY